VVREGTQVCAAGIFSATISLAPLVDVTEDAGPPGAFYHVEY